MIFRAPEYYKEFKCTADKCKDNCCTAGWEIDIDEDTVEYYKNLKGELGKKLIENIEFSSGNPHFKLNECGKCVFLNEKNLCDVYLKLGEGGQGYICREHPRYYEWFNNVKEAGIGLCCEESARIILSQKDKFKTYEIEIEGNNTEDYDDGLYNYLLKSRDAIISYLEDGENINSKIRDIIDYACNVQEDIDDGWLIEEEIIPSGYDYIIDDASLKKALEYYMTLESNNCKWKDELKEDLNIFQQHVEKKGEFKPQNLNLYMKNLAIYFIWRYFMKATYDGQVLQKAQFMAISICIIEFMLFCRWDKNGKLDLEDYIQISKMYSEEIEYCEDNVEKLNDAYQIIFNKGE